MSIALLISVYNRAPLLRRSLEALATLSQPDEFIVVDDGSSDDCADVCAAYSGSAPLRYIYNHRPDGQNNCCLARNIGIRATECDDILISEPELLPLTDLVAQLRVARESFPNDVLYGWTYHANNEGSGLGDAERMGVFPYYTLYRREWLLEVGGYDEGFEGKWAWDDVDLNGRLAEIGHNQRRIEECEGFHQWHPSRIELAQENEARARGKRWPDDIRANGEQWGVVIPRP